MTKCTQISFDEAPRLAEQFGPLSLEMLTGTELSSIWRVSFLANFFTGPIYAKVLSEFGLSRPGFVILYSLSQKDGLVAQDICLVTGLPKNSISRAVTDLESKGLLARETATEDKRAKPLSITPRGCKLLEEVVPLFVRRQAAMLQPLDEKEVAEFDRLVSKIVSAMPSWVSPD